MLISLVVPCYNEEEAMPLFYKEVSRVAETMRQSHGAEFEFIFVDDGSKDGTLRVARELHDQDPRVRYVSFSRNFGKEAGIYAGLQAARGDYVATMDADLQDPPALLPDMLDALLSGDWDCAATRRTTRKGEPPVRSWFARKFYQIINRTGDGICPVESLCADAQTPEECLPRIGEFVRRMQAKQQLETLSKNETK